MTNQDFDKPSMRHLGKLNPDELVRNNLSDGSSDSSNGFFKFRSVKSYFCRKLVQSSNEKYIYGFEKRPKLLLAILHVTIEAVSQVLFE